MKIALIACMAILFAFPCQAEIEEATETTRQECVDILVKLRDLSPKVKLRVNLERFRVVR